MNCPKCGAQLPDGAKFCGSCGARLTEPTQTIVAHQEALRMPASWGTVDQYVAYVAARAAAPCE